jgi:hypothetical protein
LRFPQAAAAYDLLSKSEGASLRGKERAPVLLAGL